MKRPPLPVTIIGCIFLASGAIGIAWHLTEFDPWVLLVRLLAVICGIQLLRGKGWARWLAVVWLAYHVILSAFHSASQAAMHALLLAVFAWFLFRPPSKP